MRSYVVATDENDAKEILMSKGAYVDGVEQGVLLHYLSENTCRLILENRAVDWVNKDRFESKTNTTETSKKDVFSLIDFDF